MATTEFPPEVTDILNAPGIAHMATIGPDGTPHSSPVWYEWTGSELLISHTKDRQKYKNLQRDPRFTVSILDPKNPYRFVEARGTAEITDDPEAKLIHLLAKKYMGKDSYQGEVGERVVIKLKPSKIVVYG